MRIKSALVGAQVSHCLYPLIRSDLGLNVLYVVCSQHWRWGLAGKTWILNWTLLLSFYPCVFNTYRFEKQFSVLLCLPLSSVLFTECWTHPCLHGPTAAHMSVHRWVWLIDGFYVLNIAMRVWLGRSICQHPSHTHSLFILIHSLQSNENTCQKTTGHIRQVALRCPSANQEGLIATLTANKEPMIFFFFSFFLHHFNEIVIQMLHSLILEKENI